MQEFDDWLKLRSESIDEFKEKLCYCGHTFKCSCADPGISEFKQAIENKTIILNDKNNGWKNKLSNNKLDE